MNFRSVKKQKEEQKEGIRYALIVVLVILGFSGFYRFLSTGLHPFGRPFWQLTEGQGLSLSFVLKDKHRLEKKVAELEALVKTQELELMRLAMFQDENETFKKISTELPSDAVVAGILVKPNHTLYDTMIIDVGARDGVEKGDLVLGYGSVVLGKIGDVRQTTSHVELFTENEELTLFVHLNTSIFVEALGHGNGMVIFTVPRDVPMTIGDVLAFPGRTGLLFGTVEEIQFEATDPVQTIIGRSAVNIHELRFVEVIDGYVE